MNSNKNNFNIIKLEIIFITEEYLNKLRQNNNLGFIKKTFIFD